jgi:hypothetical protein
MGIETLVLNMVEHEHGVHVYVWRNETLGRSRKRRQVAVLWLEQASISGTPSALVEALLFALRSAGQ